MSTRPWGWVLGCVAVQLLAAASAYGVIVDSILATVDREVILQSDVFADIAPEISRLRQDPAMTQEEFDREVETRGERALEQAIENRILLREAQLAGLEVTDEDVDERLDEVRKQYPSQEEFLKELASFGETLGDLRVRIRKQVLARTMAVKKIQAFEKEVVVSELDVAQYYEAHRAEFERPERVRCRQIFLSAGSEAAERAQARAKLEEVRRELEAGADFAQLAAAHSQAPGAEQGGIIGWVTRGDLVEPLEAAAFSVPEGEVSEVIETDAGLSLIKVEKKESAGLASLDEVRAEIEPKLRSQGGQERYRKWMEELRKRSRVRIFLD